MTLRRSLVLLGLAVAVLVAALLGYRAGERLSARASTLPSAGPDAAAPGAWLEIPAPDVPFRTLDGDEVRLSDFRGRVVILNFWGTWCPPCRAEIPELVRLQTALEELGGTVIGPAVDSGSPKEIRAFAREQRINYPLWIVSDEVAATRFGAPGYPFTMLIDRNGIVRRTYIGARTEKILLRDVGDLLAHGPSGRAAD